MRRRALLFAGLVWAAGAVGLGAQAPAAKMRDAAVWVASWGAAQQTPEPANALAAADLTDATVRQVFHLSLGGARLRVHVSNAFGTEALRFGAVHVAQPAVSGSEAAASGGAIDPASDRTVTFAGAASVVVPPGAEMVSDAVDWPVAGLNDVAVTFYLEKAPVGETGHPGSRATTWYAHGNQAGAARLEGAKTVEHWYGVSGIDVEAPAGAGAIVALGDSLTDGHGATTNGNDRWTDVLAKRLQSAEKTKNIGVVNAGIGGNHLLTDGLGPNALARFDRDVLGRAGVRWVIVFEGVNDLGGLAREGEVSAAEHAAMVARVEAAYGQLVERAHAQGLKVWGATITPYMGSAYYHPGPLSEADRQAVNGWIRAPGHFDGVIDFDAVVRDPQRPDRLLPACDGGDHLHPGPAGYRAMGEAAEDQGPRELGLDGIPIRK